MPQPSVSAIISSASARPAGLSLMRRYSVSLTAGPQIISGKALEALGPQCELLSHRHFCLRRGPRLVPVARSSSLPKCLGRFRRTRALFFSGLTSIFRARYASDPS
jgi:hypothetical protein